MSRVCELSGIKPMSGNKVSHAHNKTRRVQLPNLQRKKVWVPELNRHINLRISTRMIRTLSKSTNILKSLRDYGYSI